jgi:hypothetical protein
MKLQKLLLATVAVGIAVNIYDYLLHGILLQGPLYSHLTSFMRADASFPLLVLTDFVSALVFVWVYDRVQVAFPSGPMGGAVFGLYAAVLVGFPTWISCYLLFTGFTYGLAWAWTLAGLGWGLIAGAIAGMVYRTRA